MKNIKTISFIGSGNVASAIAQKLVEKDFIISQVYSRNKNNAIKLAKKVNAKPISDIINLIPADLYILAIKDDAIENISKQIKHKSIPIVHTSGTVSNKVFSKNDFILFGCLYPLQTFTKNRKLRVNNFPILIESNDKKLYNQLEKIASAISGNLLQANSTQRLHIHLAAVIACNFTNYLYSVSENILQKENFKIDLLYPLIKQTAENTKKGNVISLQTGPAIRKDFNTINKHLMLLNKNKELKILYNLITSEIMKNNKIKI